MDSKIEVQSAIDAGAKFSFTIVLPRSTATLVPVAEVAAPADDFSGKKILLAEDVDLNCEVVIALLEPTNVAITCAKNGAEAVKIFHDNPCDFDLIFMDIHMPEVDGYEATQQIRALADTPNAKTVPIIAMTANVFREDVEKCLAAGMNDHIGKPLDIDLVLEKMRRYLQDQ
jgi:CheY-like chemotaxis protein